MLRIEDIKKKYYKEIKIMNELKIPMFEVESSNLKAIGYHKPTLTLRIQFKSSATFYDYKGVSPEIFLECIAAESMGRFFLTKIKGKYECLK